MTVNSPARRKEILSNKAIHHPAVVQLAMRHAAHIQYKIADVITTFAGSMNFVYIHAVLFLGWIAFNLIDPKGFDRYPFGLLTLIVSLEAIFLSTFVMIGQNRQAAFQQDKADHDYNTEHKELSENTELTREVKNLSNQILELQKDLKALLEQQAK
jgi:uncharacterized membrane protein